MRKAALVLLASTVVVVLARRLRRPEFASVEVREYTFKEYPNPNPFLEDVNLPPDPVISRYWE